MSNTDTRPQFEDACWAHYQGLKARGWSHPDEGDPNSRGSLFWREANGQYGVRQIEAAWRGWLMREAALGEPVAWRTFDGEGGYDYRTYEDNESYRNEYVARNGVRYANWVEALYVKSAE
jgi:hypothetical protein